MSDELRVLVARVPTAVHITGEGVVQNLFAGPREPPSYLFVLDIEQEYLRRMCRTSQTWTMLVRVLTQKWTQVARFTRALRPAQTSPSPTVDCQIVQYKKKP
jgi:16S rRNA A1518/A1519 N6-dimethyltransferase RsmA/KsgA/DIM1 with predicted DNA glycosylase/AP lyase activity